MPLHAGELRHESRHACKVFVAFLITPGPESLQGLTLNSSVQSVDIKSEKKCMFGLFRQENEFSNFTNYVGIQHPQKFECKEEPALRGHPPSYHNGKGHFKW